jgi:hypothetical protein
MKIFTHVESFHVFVELFLPVIGQFGEDGVVGDAGPVPLVQPVGQQILRFDQQRALGGVDLLLESISEISFGHNLRTKLNRGELSKCHYKLGRALYTI